MNKKRIVISREYFERVAEDFAISIMKAKDEQGRYLCSVITPMIAMNQLIKMYDKFYGEEFEVLVDGIFLPLKEEGWAVLNAEEMEAK